MLSLISLVRKNQPADRPLHLEHVRPQLSPPPHPSPPVCLPPPPHTSLRRPSARHFMTSMTSHFSHFHAPLPPHKTAFGHLTKPLHLEPLSTPHRVSYAMNSAPSHRLCICLNACNCLFMLCADVFYPLHALILSTRSHNSHELIVDGLKISMSTPISICICLHPCLLPMHLHKAPYTCTVHLLSTLAPDPLHRASAPAPVPLHLHRVLHAGPCTRDRSRKGQSRRIV